MTKEKYSQSIRNIKIGKRLKECLDLRSMTASDLARQSSAQTDKVIPTSYISMVINGKRPLNSERATLFADALQVNVGYLVGDDKLFSDSYDEYLQDLGISHTMNKLNYIFEGTGFRCSEVSAVDNTVTDYTITNGKESATIPAKAMDNFFNIIRATVSNTMENWIDVYSDNIDLQKIDQELKRQYSIK